jgi:hypothetical protein
MDEYGNPEDEDNIPDIFVPMGKYYKMFILMSKNK